MTGLTPGYYWYLESGATEFTVVEVLDGKVWFVGDDQSYAAPTCGGFFIPLKPPVMAS